MSEAPTLSPLTWEGDRAPLAKALGAPSQDGATDRLNSPGRTK